jgi:hypothetical protein
LKRTRVATRRRPPTRRSPARHPLPPSRELTSEWRAPNGDESASQRRETLRPPTFARAPPRGRWRPRGPAGADASVRGNAVVTVSGGASSRRLSHSGKSGTTGPAMVERPRSSSQRHSQATPSAASTRRIYLTAAMTGLVRASCSDCAGTTSTSTRARSAWPLFFVARHGGEPDCLWSLGDDRRARRRGGVRAAAVSDRPDLVFCHPGRGTRSLARSWCAASNRRSSE